MKKNLIVGAMLLSAAMCAKAEEPPILEGWALLSSSNLIFVYAKKGSGELVKGTRSMLVQYVPSSNNPNQSVMFTKMTVTDRECKSGYGVIKFYDLSGQFSYKTDYVKGGGSISAAAADILCIVDFNK